MIVPRFGQAAPSGTGRIRDMFAVFTYVRKAVARVIAPVSLLVLAACDTAGITTGGPSVDTNKPIPVALLVPKGSGQSGDAILAQSLENAARIVACTGGSTCPVNRGQRAERSPGPRTWSSCSSS